MFNHLNILGLKNLLNEIQGPVFGTIGFLLTESNLLKRFKFL